MDESYKFHHFGLFKFRKHLFICFHDSLFEFQCTKSHGGKAGVLKKPGLVNKVLMTEEAEMCQCSAAGPSCDKLLVEVTLANVRPEPSGRLACKQLPHCVTLTPAAAGSAYCSRLPVKASH